MSSSKVPLKWTATKKGPIINNAFRLLEKRKTFLIISLLQVLPRLGRPRIDYFNERRNIFVFLLMNNLENKANKSTSRYLAWFIYKPDRKSLQQVNTVEIAFDVFK